jgi:hypothetical protein
MPISGYRRAWSDNEFSKEDAVGEALRLNFGLELVQFSLWEQNFSFQSLIFLKFGLIFCSNVVK